MSTDHLAPCPRCPDGHDDPRRKPWSVWVGLERDGDGRPTALHVAPSDGAHVAESDAQWLRELIATYRSGITLSKEIPDVD